MTSIEKRVLVTGACGSIGSALVERLLAEGFVVCAFDNNENGLFKLDQNYKDLYKNRLRLFVGDIRDKERLIKVLSYHITEGRVDAEQAAADKYADSLEGTNLQLLVKGSRLTVEKTLIVEENIRASNGIVHVIEKVLMPKSK